MSLPILIIVPTSFPLKSLYDGQVDFLRSKGYTAYSLDLPCTSYTPDTPAPSMHDDAERIRNLIIKLADEEKDIVLLAHSYGSVPASQSLKGLTKTERSANGKKGGVVRIAYTSGIVPKVGENTIDIVSAVGKGGAPEVKIDQFGWMTLTNPEETANLVFSSLSPEVKISKSKGFQRQAAKSFMEPLSHPGYRDLPVSWYFCEEDLAVVAEVQQIGIDTIEQSWNNTERSGKKVSVTRNKCDHMPMCSATDHFNAWVEQVMVNASEN